MNTYGRLLINYVQHIVGRKIGIFVALLDVHSLRLATCLNGHYSCARLFRSVR